MKHLVIFLNYTQSRIDNPVYRLFATESLSRRNATLLYLPKPLEERELLHEVDKLRGKHHQASDVTFHICTTIRQDNDADGVIATAHLIRSNFLPGGTSEYPVFAYCLVPPVPGGSDREVTLVWRNLVNLNRAATEYAHVELLRTVFLYTDDTQQQLARYLFHSTRAEAGSGFLRTKSGSGTPADGDTSATTGLYMPPLFGAFNADGISYPEQAIRAYLHHACLLAVMQQGFPEVNPTSIEQCNNEAMRILSFLPLQNDRICLQAESFLNLGDDNSYIWTPTADYWLRNTVLSAGELSEIPRNDWFIKLQQHANLHYQGKFRNMGVDYFFSMQQKKTERYAEALLGIVRLQLMQTALSQPFTPETMKAVVRALTNRLQQKVIELTAMRSSVAQQVETCQQRVEGLKEKWNERSLLTRLRGKDTQTLELYQQALAALQEQKTWIPGCDFAIKLLNELIPQVAALVEPFDLLERQLEDAVALTLQNMTDTDPTAQFGLFPAEPLQQAVLAIKGDTAFTRAEYLRVVALSLQAQQHPTGEQLLTLVRSELLATTDEYLDRGIAGGQLPEVLNLPVTQRLDRLCREQGGLQAFVGRLQRQTPVSLALKETSVPEDNCWLVGAGIPDSVGLPHFDVADISGLQLLHVVHGVRLTDLDGFAGQRMFIEPSIF